MSVPPPQPPNGPSGSGGGFGPPPGGFGPTPGGFGEPGSGLPPGQGGYGYPAPSGGYGYVGGAGDAPGGPGGYGPGMPPGPPLPPGGGGRGAKVTAAVIGGVVVLALIIGGLVWLSGKDAGSSKPIAKESPSPSVPSVPTDLPTPSVSGIPSFDPSDLFPSSSSTDIPYVVLDPGVCFNTPGLDSSAREVEKVSCSRAHDGEVISNATLSGTFSTESELTEKAGDLCEADANRVARRQADGRTYYNYVLYPVLATYNQGKKTVSCSLTLSNVKDGPKLTGPLS